MAPLITYDKDSFKMYGVVFWGSVCRCGFRVKASGLQGTGLRSAHVPEEPAARLLGNEGRNGLSVHRPRPKSHLRMQSIGSF